MKLILMLKTNKELRIIFYLLLLGIATYFIANMFGDRTQMCKEAGGVWSKKYNECENVNLGKCVNMGGFYNFCASPCRHYAEENIAEVCERKCVQVCEFINPFKGKK